MIENLERWIAFANADLSNLDICYIVVDTRDFHLCIGKDKNQNQQPIIDNFAQLLIKTKVIDRFIYTQEEIKNLLHDLLQKSGGEVGWRMLTFKGIGEGVSANWELKYITFIKTEKGWICSNRGGTGRDRLVPKNVFQCDVNEEYLNAH